VTHFRGPVPEAEQSDKKRQEERDRARLAIEIFVLAVLVIGTKFAWDNIQLLNDNLREATRSANAAVDAAQHRGWSQRIGHGSTSSAGH
jgi:hypothetical protein